MPWLVALTPIIQTGIMALAGIIEKAIVSRQESNPSGVQTEYGKWIEQHPQDFASQLQNIQDQFKARKEAERNKQ